MSFQAIRDSFKKTEGISMHPPFLKQLSKQTQNIKQFQHLMISQDMQQALHILQCPIMELQPLIELELEQNPILEYENEEDIGLEQDEKEEELDPSEVDLNFNEKDFKIMEQLDEEFEDHFKESGTEEKRKTLEDEKLKSYLDSLILQKTTLFTHLMQQVREITDSPQELQMAEAIIGHLDRDGFLKNSLTEIASFFDFEEKSLQPILDKIKTLDPIGIGASNLKESFLIQLKRLGKENSIAFQIIDRYYEELLHHRIPLIKKGLKLTTEAISKAINEDISKLQMHPGNGFTNDVTHYIVPDIIIKEDVNENANNEKNHDFTIFVNEDPLPPLKLNQRYIKLLQDETLAQETKEFINQKIASAKWLLKNLTKRNETLVKIAHALVKRQKAYLLSPNGLLVPMTMMEIACEIELHESTVARAVTDKYIQTPRGLKLLRSFFTTAYVAVDGSSMSSDTVKTEVFEIIENEDKKKPLSDLAISKMLEKKGILCARRTIAKYRYQLNLGNTQQRKSF